ncbi:MAG: DUF1236 domain-containing protein [Beijerinckiaceae bacterium]
MAAAQQRMEGSPGGASGVQGPSQHESGSATHERRPGMRQPGMMQERQPGMMQGQGRSGAVEEKQQRSGQPGMMQGQGRPGAVEEKQQRSGQPGAMPGRAQKSGAIEEKQQRSGRQPGAMQGSAQERTGRSVAPTTFTGEQKTRLQGVITGGNLRRIDNANFPLSIGTRVPSTVVLYDVPGTIVNIVPQYRGFRYIVVGQQLVIIDPNTLSIVAVI